MLSMIAAMGTNRVIGRDGSLPWRLPADLRWFKSRTMGHAVIMGRKTFESVGMALPGRRTLVVSRTLDRRAEGCELFRSLDAALEACADDPEPFIVGGGQIYRLALPRADRVYLTVVDQAPEGDATFPELGAEWVVTWREAHPADARHASGFEFRVYERRGS